MTAPVAGLVTESTWSPAPTRRPAPRSSSTRRPTRSPPTSSERHLADVKLGQTAAITIAALGADVEGKVSAIAPVASEDSGSGVVSYPVTVTITSAPDGVHSGMSADVTITTASATDVLTVPAAALQGRDGNYAVMTLGADGTPVRTAVQVGLVTNTLAEITSGLTEGTAVVTGTASDLAGTATNQNGGFGGPPGGGLVVNGGGPVREFRNSNGN